MIQLLNSWDNIKLYLSCQNCQYANYYPAYWWFRHYDPWCSKGHGKCRIDKRCENFKLIGRLSK